MKESILNDKILTTINKWGAVYQDDLLYHLSKQDFNIPVCRVYIGRLIKKGLIEKVSDIKRSNNSILIAKKSKSFYSSADDTTDTLSHFGHDSTTSGLCLEIARFSTVADINIFRASSDNFSNKGEIIPDAEVVFWANDFKSITYGAIEVELNQKNKAKIITKLSQYATNSNYSHVFYFFTNKNTALSYNIILSDLISKNTNSNNYDFNKFIFLFRRSSELKTTSLDSYSTFNLDSMKTFKSLLK